MLHDSEPELRVLLDSIERHLPDPPQLVVVDSGSRDGGAALARERGAEVVELPDNPGFGAACNAGSRAPATRHRPAQPRLRAARRLARPPGGVAAAAHRPRCTPRGC